MHHGLPKSAEGMLEDVTCGNSCLSSCSSLSPTLIAGLLFHYEWFLFVSDIIILVFSVDNFPSNLLGILLWDC